MTQYTLLMGSYIQGITIGQFDSITGTLTAVHQAQSIAEPTYLDTDPQNHVYAIQQSGNRSGLASFQLQPDHQLTPLDQQLNWSAAPVHVNALTSHPLVFLSNYRTGVAQIYQRDAAGHLHLTDHFQNTGHGVLPQQTSSHVHFMALTPDQRLVVLDLGTDELIVFNLDLTTGRLKSRQATFHFRPGFGPRHLLFQGTTALVLGELASEVAVLSYNTVSGSFQQRQLISTLPDEWVGNNGGGGIHLAPSGHYLYVSNRGHNSIVTYRVLSRTDGAYLEKCQTIASGGDFPRDFCLSPDGRFLLVGHQKTNDVTIFKVDGTTGQLTRHNQVTDILAPVCLKMI
ncbi:lactonase family protein [Levilactobacillus spicheri]|uniref:6-phosphogluconolactonase n=2 Tax=Levilactobacillus spicheri TaxID=216463 RepID=A0ABQ0WRC5_9LACO|nr:lactonase family protein [Levilactobacillus spicheri]GEO67638.1 6-phosphogluconolactonase [Levilactobacillus spicheri]